MAKKISPVSRGSHLAAPLNIRTEFLLYIGSYNQSRRRGIHAFRFDAATGRLSALGLAAEAVNPTFVTVAPGSRFLYATKEVARHAGKRSGAVRAY